MSYDESTMRTNRKFFTADATRASGDDAGKASMKSFTECDNEPYRFELHRSKFKTILILDMEDEHMAMPNYETIKADYLAGRWNDRMLRTALTCKAITREQYEEILDAKRSMKSAK